MSRGLGTWQRAILAALEEQPGGVLLADVGNDGAGVSPSAYSARQRAARSLAARGLCTLARIWATSCADQRTAMVMVLPVGADVTAGRAKTGYEVSVERGQIHRLQHLGAAPAAMGHTGGRPSSRPGPVRGPVALAGAAIAGLVGGIIYFKDELLALFEPLERLSAAIETALADAVEKAGEKLSELAAGFIDFRDRMVALWGELRDAIARIAGEIYDAVVGWWGRMWDSLAATAEDGVRGQIGAFEKMRDVLVGNSIIPDTVDDILDEWGRLDAGMKAGSRGTADAVAAEFSTMSTGLLDPFKSALREGELSFRSFADVLTDIGRRLADDLLDQAFRPIEDAIANLFSGAGSTGGSGSGLFSGLGSLVSGFFGGGGGTFAPLDLGFAGGFYADGGRIPSGGWGIVGEAGAELVKGPAQVFSNADTMRMLGDGGGEPDLHLTQNFDMRGANVSESRMKQIAEESTRRGFASMVETRRENPGFLR